MNVDEDLCTDESFDEVEVDDDESWRAGDTAVGSAGGLALAPAAVCSALS